MFKGAVSGSGRAKGAGEGERWRVRGPLGRAGVVMADNKRASMVFETPCSLLTVRRDAVRKGREREYLLSGVTEEARARPYFILERCDSVPYSITAFIIHNSSTSSSSVNIYNTRPAINPSLFSE